MDLFPDTFQNCFNERKCAGIMGDYANKCAMAYSRVCYDVPSLLSKVWRVESTLEESLFLSLRWIPFNSSLVLHL